MNNKTLTLYAHNVYEDGKDTILIDLRDPDNNDLPRFQSGAHIDIHTENGLIRQYSLCNNCHEKNRYLVAVLLANPSRGGSEWIHKNIKKGSRVKISEPRNHFNIDKNASKSILIAGGIGITPILSMAYELESLNKTWEIHYSAKKHSEAALLEPLKALEAASLHGKICIYFTQEGDDRMSFKHLFEREENQNTHFYCCGSNAFLDAYIEASQGIPSNYIHFERFSSNQASAKDNQFTLVLAKSQKELSVNVGETILDVLNKNHIRVNYMCSEGVCGSCEVTVLEGTPDHRDSILSEQEKAANETMMVCCSGSLTKRLIIDL